MAVFAAIQSATITISPIMVTLLGGVIAIAVAWGVIQATIRGVKDELGRVRHDMRNWQQTQQTMMVETLERIARIEGKLNV